MAFKLGYDCGMRRMALFTLVLTAFLMAGYSVPTVHAQANWAPSVTSMGFGGNHVNGIPPSVTSLGFGQTGFGQTGFAQTGFAHTGTPGWSGGHTPFHNPMFPIHNPMFPGTPIGNFRHHHGSDFPYYPVWGGYYAYPVYIDSGEAYQQNLDSGDNAENPDEYRGGPTIFDRRGDGQYVPSGSTRRSELDQETLAAVSQPPPGPPPEVANQPQTVLVFKDGHQASVDNYAIVGSTLYDLSGGKRHKIPLADLDLNATAQQNDDRGVDFEVPTSSPAN
jgi:hypothetical protein